LDARAETGRVIASFIIGMLDLSAASIAGGIVLAIIGAIFGAAVALSPDILANPELLMNNAAGLILAAILLGVFYIGFLLALGGVNLVMITQKIIGHVVDSVTLANAEHLDQIQQRAADTGADAEGFADALDIGGAI